MFVDDDPLVLDGFRTAFHRAPFEVLVAHSAEQALERLNHEHVDVVITDERMPGINGSELCATLAGQSHEAVRILLTGHATLEAALRAVNEGEVFKILCKPIDPGELANLIDEALDKRNGLMPSIDGGGLNRRADILSARERQVAEMLVGGMRTPQIADRLFISRHTVRNHLKSMFAKLNVHSQGELVEHLRG
ncbi:MAG: response regulator [Bradymonadia bacterium]